MLQRAVMMEIENSDRVAVAIHGEEPLAIGADHQGGIVVVGAELSVSVVVDASPTGVERISRKWRQRTITCP